MSGLPENNHPAFFDAEKRLKDAHPDAEIINPARNDIGDTAGMTSEEIWEAYMVISREQVKRSDWLVLMPGWNLSKGASEEASIAFNNKIPIRRIDVAIRMLNRIDVKHLVREKVESELGGAK